MQVTIDDLTVEQIKEMSDEEVAFWFGVAQQEEQIKKMRQGLINRVEVLESQRDARTIKIDSKVIN